MELNEHIISKTFELMARLGITSVTMDMIAQHCGISKRTLYEHFSDKRTLVRIVIMDMYHKRNLGSLAVLRNSKNKLEAILQIYFQTREYVLGVSEAFVSDLNRMYPDIKAECMRRERVNAKQLADLLRQGQEEGVFRKTRSCEINSVLLNLQLRNAKANMVFFPPGESVVDVLDAAFINFIRGMASIRGIEIIDKALSEHNIDQ